MEIHGICTKLETMMHNLIGLGVYKKYIIEAIKELRIYQQRLEYENSCGYRNDLDLVRDHAKDLEDENAILKEANERFHTELRLATKYVRETRIKLRRAQHNMWQSEDEVASLTEKLRKKELEVQQLTQTIQDTGEEVNLREENTKLKNRIAELIRNRDDIVKNWTNHCENLFHEHRKCLAAKDREIYELRRQRDEYENSTTYWKCKCLKPKKAQANNAANFCGNCKYCKYMEGQAYCQHPRVCIWSIDPDDASCPAFESNQVDNVIVGKPEFPCCNGCNREDCDDCTLCPF